MPPAGPANKRKPVRIVLDPDDRPVAKGNLSGLESGEEQASENWLN
jgi:hypothetical protein